MNPEIWVKSSDMEQALPIEEVTWDPIGVSLKGVDLKGTDCSPTTWITSTYSELNNEIREQKEKIESLSDENQKLKEELATYKEIKEYF